MTDGKDLDRKSDPHDTPHSSSRRRILTALAAGTGAAVLLPEKWVKPVVDKVLTPIHAQATVACFAPAGCYTGVPADNPSSPPRSFQWPGGQGPETLLQLEPGCGDRVPDTDEITLVVASSAAEASSLLGGPAVPVIITGGPSLPDGCSFYFDDAIEP